jgi:hypothetical protein
MEREAMKVRRRPSDGNPEEKPRPLTKKKNAPTAASAKTERARIRFTGNGKRDP